VKINANKILHQFNQWNKNISVMNKAYLKKEFPAKIKIEGRWIHIGDFPSYMEASLARAAAGTLWNRVKGHVSILGSWDTQEGA
jgi:hypothetical protein